MFGKKKKKDQKEIKKELPLTDANIYTIPDKFYLPNLNKGGGDKSKLVGILIMLLAFLAIVIGGYFFVTKIIF